MNLQYLSSYIPIDRRRVLSPQIATTYRSYGTALFADISGFTLLTERLLSIYGKRRAPAELTRYINQTYAALITPVHRCGGVIISFAGDAITCWFEGDDGKRGVACGLGMQQAMTTFQAIPLGSTTTALRVSVGVATGQASRFVIGELHYLDVLAGETINRMAQAGEVAARGELAVSREAVSADMTVTEWRGEFAIINNHSYITNNHGTSVIPMPFALNPKWFIPTIYKRLQTKTHFLAQIRPVAILFCNFQGLDYDHDLEAPLKLHTFISDCQQELLRLYDGHIFQVIVGDKGSYFYAMFGVPQAHSNDPERAGRAALDIQQIAKQYSYLQKIKIGVTYGRLRTGDYGSDTRRTFGGLGDTVNIAARLMSEAEPSQILATKSIFEATKQHLQFEFLNQRQLKGKRAHIAVWELLGERPPAIHHAFIDYPDPLLGRDGQLEQLDQILELVLSGQEQVIFVEGNKGIGKTHLAAEFIERAIRHNIRVAIGGCQESTQHTSYAPWRQIFMTLLHLPHHGLKAPHLEKIVHRFNPDWVGRVPLLGDLLGVEIPDTDLTASLDPKTRRDSLFDLVDKMLRRLGGIMPMFLFIDDTHWMDELSWELFGSLCRVQWDVPILYLLGQRPDRNIQEFTRLTHVHHLPLQALPADSAKNLTDYQLQGDTSQLAQDLIYNHAQGIPFFMRELIIGLRETNKLYYHQRDDQWRVSEEMFEALHQANCLVKVNGVWELDKTASLANLNLGLPDQIHSLILSRIEHLPLLSQTTLKVASVIGRIFEFEVLAAAHPNKLTEAQLKADIETLHQLDFIQPDQSHPELAFIFRHNITQQVVLETLPNDQAAQVHHNIATVIEQLYPTSIERLAYHYWHAQVLDKAIIYLEKSAYKAQIEYANESALYFYQQLLTVENQPAWRIEQINLLHLMGNRSAEKAALQKLADASAYQDHFLWGRYYEVIGNYDEARQAYQQAMEYIEQISDETRCWVHMGNIAYAQGKYQQANTAYHHALGLFELDTAPVETTGRIIIDAFQGIGTIYRQLGDFEGATTYAEDALALSKQLGDKQHEATAYFKLGVIAAYQRRNHAAERHGQQALTIQRLIGDRVGEGKSLKDLASIVRNQGRYHQAQLYSKQALTILQATNNRWDEVNVWMELGIMFQELGAFDKAEEALRLGMEIAEDIGDEVGVAYMLVNWGLTELDRGDYALAEQLLLRGLTIAKATDQTYLLTHFYTYLSLVYLAINMSDKVIAYSEKALTLHNTLKMKWATTDNLAILATIYLNQGDITQAMAYAEQAWALLEACQGDGPEFLQRDYCACGDVFQQAGDSRSTQAYSKARTLIEARANDIQDEDLRETYLQNNAKFLL